MIKFIRNYFALPNDIWGDMFVVMVIIVPVLVIASEVVTHAFY